ncbi:MAG: DUF5615 family PIN-like protein [Candidatus Blackburnbacteria bacterium]|nr:DUF5615 family PIN-like protein [Candidatus Blackburnbacteria bacterium]
MSTPNRRFLLDENVRIDLARFLKAGGFDVLLAPKSAPDSKLAAISKKEKRVLVTNDSDFEDYAKNTIYAVVLLKVPQSKASTLTLAFDRLLRKDEDMAGKIVVLRAHDEDVSPLTTELKE